MSGETDSFVTFMLAVDTSRWDAAMSRFRASMQRVAQTANHAAMRLSILRCALRPKRSVDVDEIFPGYRPMSDVWPFDGTVR